MADRKMKYPLKPNLEVSLNGTIVTQDDRVEVPDPIPQYDTLDHLGQKLDVQRGAHDSFYFQQNRLAILRARAETNIEAVKIRQAAELAESNFNRQAAIQRDRDERDARTAQRQAVADAAAQARFDRR